MGFCQAANGKQTTHNMIPLKFISVLVALFMATIALAQPQKPITVGILKFQSHFIMLGNLAQRIFALLAQ
jgi:hypothetical protein